MPIMTETVLGGSSGKEKLLCGVHRQSPVGTITPVRRIYSAPPHGRRAVCTENPVGDVRGIDSESETV